VGCLWEGVGKQVGEHEEMRFVERVVVSTTLGVVWSQRMALLLSS
jgi:hypothetical protein